MHYFINLSDFRYVTSPCEEIITFAPPTLDREQLLSPIIDGGCNDIRLRMRKFESRRLKQGMDGIPLKLQLEKDNKAGLAMIRLLQNLNVALISLGKLCLGTFYKCFDMNIFCRYIFYRTVGRLLRNRSRRKKALGKR
jgi:hypothetical protein